MTTADALISWRTIPAGSGRSTRGNPRRSPLNNCVMFSVGGFRSFGRLDSWASFTGPGLSDVGRTAAAGNRLDDLYLFAILFHEVAVEVEAIVAGAGALFGGWVCGYARLLVSTVSPLSVGRPPGCLPHSRGLSLSDVLIVRYMHHDCHFSA